MSNRHSQITLVLNRSEMAALRCSADSALRRPRDQARFILREALGLTNSLHDNAEYGDSLATIPTPGIGTPQ